MSAARVMLPLSTMTMNDFKRLMSMLMRKYLRLPIAYSLSPLLQRGVPHMVKAIMRIGPFRAGKDAFCGAP
jgi:hypothetical protein